MRILARVLAINQGLKSRWRNFYYRLLGVKLQGYVWMRQIEIPQNHQGIQIAAGASLDRGVVLLCTGPSTGSIKIHIGSGTYINRNTMLDAAERLEIGSDCAIGPGCYLTDHDHGMNPSLPPLGQPLISSPTRLGNGVWLGGACSRAKRGDHRRSRRRGRGQCGHEGHSPRYSGRRRPSTRGTRPD